MSISNLKRTIVELSDEKDGRIYFDRLKNTYPSVTTVLSYHNDPNKEGALRGWRNKYDGKDGRAYHEHINDYSKWRGTMIHWYILHYLNPDLDVTHEEEEAMDEIKNRDRDYSFVRSIALNHDGYTDKTFPSETEYWNTMYDPQDDDPITLTDFLARDMSWAGVEFAKLLPRMDLANRGFLDSTCKTLKSYFSRDVRQSQVLETEEYVSNDEHHYAGQFDCLYETRDGEVILFDIKTGKGVYWDYPRQLAAYAKAIEDSPEFPYESIDTLQIARLKPDNKDVELSTDDDWGIPRDQLWSEFKELTDTAQSDVKNIDLINATDASTSWFTSDEKSSVS